MEQPGLERALIWDINIADSDLIHCTIKPAPERKFTNVLNIIWKRAKESIETLRDPLIFSSLYEREKRNGKRFNN